jgi:hypothetical protein
MSLTAGIRFPLGQKIFLFFRASRPAQGSTQPPIQWVPGTLTQGVKWPGYEADHSPPPSAEVKHSGAMPQLHNTPSWRAACLIKRKENFTFTLYN